MPTLQLKLSAPVGEDIQNALARELTALTASQLSKREEVTALMIELLPASRWFIAGQAAQGPTAWLEISITAGTNTLAQKAAFIEGVYAILKRQLAPLGELEAASYVIVRELPAADWGYGGRTQAERRLSSAELGARP